ncbi:MAG: radical SAM protein, partial [Acetobacteraceae bacterium]|nr:radical SAM protein [Acetobacteraceae bacterium]
MIASWGRRPKASVRLDFARQFAAGPLLRRALRFVGRDPARNLTRLLELGERLAPSEEQRLKVRGARQALASSAVLQTYVHGLVTGTHPHVQRRLGFNWFLNAVLFGTRQQRRMSEELGVHVPALILVDPTSACNLSCAGCEAGRYDRGDTLPFERLDRLAEEAKELGIYWFMLSGGEPLLYPRLFEFCEKHHDMAFMVYTNGTLIDEDAADRMLACGNISPAISLEGPREFTDARRGSGVFERVSQAMDLLRQRGVPFGFSLMLTRHNCREVMSDGFIDWLIEKGCRYGWTIHYVPIGAGVDTDLLVTLEQRAWLVKRVPEIRATRPLLFADSATDEQFTQGCVAGGRRYLHVTARGDVQPCGLVHFATDNINRVSLVQALKSPLFLSYQRRQPFSDNLLRPCPVFDVPQALRDIVEETGARPTHPGADDVIRDRELRRGGRLEDAFAVGAHGRGIVRLIVAVGLLESTPVELARRDIARHREKGHGIE